MHVTPKAFRRITTVLLVADCLVAAGLLTYAHHFLQEARGLRDDTGIAVDQGMALFFAGPAFLALALVVATVATASVMHRRGSAGLSGPTPFSLAVTGLAFSLLPVVLSVGMLLLLNVLGTD